MRLLCRHVTALHEKEGIAILFMDDIPERRTIAYFKQDFGQKDSKEPIIADTSFVSLL